MKTNTILKVLIILLLQLNNIVVAQQNNLKFRRITAHDGLPENNVIKIFEDSKGYIWLGTSSNGVCKYDGYNFTPYKNNRNDTNSLSGSYVTGICEDNEANIWISTIDGGLNKYIRDTEDIIRYTHIPSDTNSLISKVVRDILIDNENNLWVATEKGLCRYSKKHNNFKKYYIDNKKVDVKRLALSATGKMWIATIKNGIYLFDSEKGALLNYTENNSGLSNQIEEVFEDSKGNLWVSTKNKGVNLLLKGKDRFISFTEDLDNDTGLRGNVFRTIIEDRKGNIFINSNKGLNRFVWLDNTFINYRSDKRNKRSLGTDFLYGLHEDRLGNIWVGTWGGGISFLPAIEDKFEHYKHDPFDKNSISDNRISDFAADDNGIWITATAGGVNFFDFDTRKFSTLKSSKFKEVETLARTLFLTGNNKLWIGTLRNGLFVYDKTTGDFSHHFDKKRIFDATKIDNNEYWLICEDAIHVVDENLNIIKSFPIKNLHEGSSKTIYVAKVYKTSKNEIWIISRLGGMFLYNAKTNKFKHYKKKENEPKSLSNNKVFDIVEDTKGNLWVGTNDGLNKYNPKEDNFEYYGIENGLPDNSIKAILTDKNNHLWISTNKGISKFDTDNKTFRNFDINDGLQSNEFKIAVACKDKNGRMYFGGQNGFNVFHPDSIVYNTTSPQVVITNLQIFNKSVKIQQLNSPLRKHISQTDKIELNYKQSVFTLEFAALNYINPEKNQYAYMLEGFDNDWIYCGDQRKVTYTNLDAGDYTFKVKASNNDGYWNEKGTSLKIIISPPLWETWWFRSFVIVFIIISAISYYKIRMRRIKIRNEELEQTVHERTQDLQIVNIELEEKQEKIQTQNIDLAASEKELKESNEELSLTIEELSKQKKTLETTLNKLKETQTQLIQSEKMASVGILSAGIAHEINNPLNYISGGKFAIENYIKRNLSEHSEILKPWMERIKLGIDKASSIVRSLNHFNQQSDDYNEICDIHSIIDNCLTMLNSIITNRIEIKKQYTNTIFTLSGNDGELHQFMLNILTNAAQSINENGKITINTLIRKEHLQIEITDTGHGISTENLKKITDPFFTTKQPGKGTGLGMSIAYKIIQKHKGTIKFESKENIGTTVTVELPISF